jgi:hypothetical protein
MRRGAAILATAFVLCTVPAHAAPGRANPDTAPAAASSACGSGHVAFRATTPGAHEKRFTCGEGSWYDGGTRAYLARLSQPVHARYVTLILIHGAAVLWSVVQQVRDPGARVLRGTVPFAWFPSWVKGAHRGRGKSAPLWGTYVLSIYRGAHGAAGARLAVGHFSVVED